MTFEVGDQVLLKVSPSRGVIHFGKKGKVKPTIHWAIKGLGVCQKQTY